MLDKSMDQSERLNLASDSALVRQTTLLDLICLDELQQLQDTLAQMHGVSSFIAESDGRLITSPSNAISVCTLVRSSSKGLAHCMAAARDAAPIENDEHVRACRMCDRMGIVKTAVPIVANDIHLADWWVSQYFGPTPSREQIHQCADMTGVSAAALSSVYRGLKQGDPEKFQKTIEWLKTLSQQVVKWIYEKHVLSASLSRLNDVERALDEHRNLMEFEIEQRTADLIKANNRLQKEVYQRDLTESRLNLALESANEGLWDYTPSTGHIYYSPRWFTMLGYQSGDFPETLETWNTLTHPDDLPLLEDTLARLKSGKDEAFHIETRMLSCSGKWYWLQVRGRVVEYHDNGKAARIVGSLIDISKYKQVEVALQKANHELHRLAALDGLTQIANRRRFDDRLTQEWSRGRREKSNLAVVLCDIDYFKDYNDTYGHLKGDEALYAVAQAISTALKRPTDLVARFGGEEFAMILPNTGIKGAERVAQEVRKAVAALDIEHRSSGAGGFITLSFGGTAVVPSPHLSAKDLIERADQALYKAKSNGRNQVVCKQMTRTHAGQ